MSLKDEEKIAFVIDRDLFCHRIMPFSLKNIGVTYQWLVNKILKDKIDQNIEVYVDNMLIKSRTFGEHIGDLKETFAILCRCQMKLNLVKCTFELSKIFSDLWSLVRG